MAAPKLPIITPEQRKSGERQLPEQFGEDFRPDLVARAVRAVQSASRQTFGSAPEAGKRHAAWTSKRRRDYRTSYGYGISRVARKIHTRRGSRMHWVGALTPQTVGGRRAHPPKAEKNWEQKINAKERRKAVRSAISATVQRELVKKRGHQIPENYPFILGGAAEDIGKTKDLRSLLVSLGFGNELQRSSVKKVRAGRGKRRGRRYSRKKGLLIVVGGKCPLYRTARNLPGMEVVGVAELNAEILAPGTHAGRATLWTEKAVEVMGTKKMFV